MFGMILFWFHYIVAFLMMHTIIFGTYEKTPEERKHYYTTVYVKTDNDKRYKYPLWLILVGIVVLFIPVLNIFLYAMFMSLYPDGKEIYFKSFLTKKY